MEDKEFKRFLIRNKKSFDKHMEEFDKISRQFDQKVIDILSKL